MMEILVTILILALGILGLAGLQTRVQLAEMEAYQRSQAVVLLADMSDRIMANPSNAASYVTGTSGTNPMGTGATKSCTSPTARADKDLCEWSQQLLGAAETDAGGSKVGAMIGARGCVEQVQAPDTTATVCTPGKYRVTVTWQGLSATAAPSLTCGSGNYGTNTQQRAIATLVTIGLPTCQ